MFLRLFFLCLYLFLLHVFRVRLKVPVCVLCYDVELLRVQVLMCISIWYLYVCVCPPGLGGGCHWMGLDRVAWNRRAFRSRTVWDAVSIMGGENGGGGGGKMNRR